MSISLSVKYMPVYMYKLYVYMLGDQLVALPFVILVNKIKHLIKLIHINTMTHHSPLEAQNEYVLKYELVHLNI
jgi:hypothetical protein